MVGQINTLGDGRDEKTEDVTSAGLILKRKNTQGVESAAADLLSRSWTRLGGSWNQDLRILRESTLPSSGS
jgi:hypothetical protein